MTKKFIYYVGYEVFEGNEAWGENWKQAKETAIANHEAIYRVVVKGEQEQKEVYMDGGCFLSTDSADKRRIKVW